MQREWYLIDDDGIHPLNMDNEPEDFWKRFDRTGDESPWPPFNQLIVAAPPERTVAALRETAPHIGVELEDVTECPERWQGALVAADVADGKLTALAEPGVELDERAMALPWSEQLVEQLGCDAALFGYDPAAGTLHLTKFLQGNTEFAWADSLVPGPSYAMIFGEDGEVTDEDPRQFALQRLEMPETSPLLDRYQFVENELYQLGVDQIRPELDELPVAAAMTIRSVRQVENGNGA